MSTDRLGHRFTLLWSAGSISALGSGISNVAVPLLLASMSGDPLAVSTGRPSVPLLYAVAFLISTGATLHRTAESSMIATVVATDLLERANGRFMAARTVARDMLAGPLGGFLFVVAPAVPFAADATTFVLAAILLMFLRGRFRAPEREERAHLVAEIREGL